MDELLELRKLLEADYGLALKRKEYALQRLDWEGHRIQSAVCGLIQSYINHIDTRLDDISKGMSEQYLNNKGEIKNEQN